MLRERPDLVKAAVLNLWDADVGTGALGQNIKWREGLPHHLFSYHFTLPPMFSVFASQSHCLNLSSSLKRIS